VSARANVMARAVSVSTMHSSSAHTQHGCHKQLGLAGGKPLCLRANFGRRRGTALAHRAERERERERESFIRNYP